MKERFEKLVGFVVDMGRYIQRIKEFEMNKLGLKACHTMSIYYLGRNQKEGLNAMQLTELCKEDKSAISRSLKALQEKQLIEPCSTNDNRTYRIKYRLTEKGVQVAKHINLCVEEAIFNGGKGMTDEQRIAFYESLELITNNLSHYYEKQGEQDESHS